VGESGKKRLICKRGHVNYYFGVMLQYCTPHILKLIPVYLGRGKGQRYPIHTHTLLK